MKNLDVLQELVYAGQHPEETIQKSLKETGKPAVGCFPLIVPEEVVYAAGFLPVGLWGGISAFQQSNRYIQSFACSIMRANLELGMMGKYDFLKAVLIPSECDTLKCVCENFKVAVPKLPVIGITIPHNRTIQAAHQHLLAEFDYISGALEQVRTPECKSLGFEETFAIYEDWRKTAREFTDLVPDHLNTITPKIRHSVLKAAWFMDKKTYTEKLKAVNEALREAPKEDFTGTRLLLTGIMLDAENVLDLLEELHIGVVDDLLCHESLQFRTLAREGGSARDKIAGRILDVKGVSPLYEPMKPRGDMLADLAEQRSAAGVLFCLLKFCDPEAFDQPLVQKDLDRRGVPMLSIENDQLVESVGQLRTRIQGFLELRGL